MDRNFHSSKQRRGRCRSERTFYSHQTPVSIIKGEFDDTMPSTLFFSEKELVKKWERYAIFINCSCSNNKKEEEEEMMMAVE